MTKVLMILLVILVVFAVGCTPQETNNNGNTGSPEVTSSGKAICGDGLVQKGETSENCCQDVTCPTFSTCKELTQGDKQVWACSKSKVEDTQEYKDFLNYYGEVFLEYDKESNLVNYEYIAGKVNQMNRTLYKLLTTYTLTTEKKFVDYQYFNIQYNLNRSALIKQGDKETDETAQKQIIRQMLELDRQKVLELQKFTDDEQDYLKSKFDYDVIERISTLNKGIADTEKALEILDKGYQIEISVIDYKPYCPSYADYCYLEYVKLSIKNNGEMELENPAFDFYLYKGESVVSRDIDESSYDFESIPVKYDGIYKTSYVGYDNKEDISAGPYKLKVNLKQGVGTKVIATTTTTVNMN